MTDYIEPVGDDYPVDDEPEGPKPKRTVKGAAIVGVRLLSGTIGIGVAAAAIIAAAVLPLPTVSTAPEPVTVTPVPAAQQLVCPGPLYQLGDETGQDATTASTIGSAVVDFDSTSGAVVASTLEDATATVDERTLSPVVINSPIGDTDVEDDVVISGAQAQYVDRGDFRGLGTADCAQAATETWLVGGATSTGRTTLISLANPSDTASTVAIAIFAETGAVSVPSAEGIVVQPHSQRVLSLAGFAPAVESPVVQVVSRGGQIVANLQQSIVRGLEPGGVDIVSATNGPAASQRIPGVVVANSDVLQSRLGEDGFADLDTALRVYLPGTEPSDLQVDVTPDDGVGPESSFSITLEPGVVTDLPVDGLVDGSYTVSLSAELPVVAGLRVSTVPPADENGSSGSDFAWLASAAELSERALVTIAPGSAPELHLFNPGENDIEVDLTAIDGESRTVAVPAGASVAVVVDGGATYELGGFDALYGSVSFAAETSLAGYPVRPPTSVSGPIEIYP